MGYFLKRKEPDAKRESIDSAFEFEMGRMPTVADSKTTPSPITDMPEPVKNVLENMRIQRMSLCQSLRQYAFVYRCECRCVIIHAVLRSD